MASDVSAYWFSRLVFERGLALIYLVAFVGAANQFVPLLGERGLLSVARFTQAVPLRASPSLFFFWQSDTVLRIAAWSGVALSCLILLDIPQRRGALAAAAVWTALWILYLSFVNVGQTFYGFGWESLLLEAGFLAIFLGGRTTPPSIWLGWLWAWLLFRLMFGAGLIKLRGDPCWRDLTCLDYYFETQPMPNPLSWYFHWMPAAVHRGGVAVNHFVELIVPFFYFTPAPLSSIAALVTIVFQLVLIVSGNLSWLNWLTIVLCLPLIDDRWWSWLPVTPPALEAPASMYRYVVYGLVAVVATLSIRPTRNLLSPSQMMNFSFNPLHIVNTYGAFGSITRTRYEIVLEGTDAPVVTPDTRWREYEFKGKPGDPARRPPQVAPYHLRLDWLMWFAAMSPAPRDAWFRSLVVRLLEGDRHVVSLLDSTPFPDRPPRFLRARYYRYRFTSPEERAATGAWWKRDLAGEFMPAVSLDQLNRGSARPTMR
ncbi:MAG TPA: lipase maturation factor family protein [Vicinamibacterales bacterium]|nr:lipase maturation factor family protein [Vicinamibacterales bacterium]